MCFSHYQKCDNHVITPSNVGIFFQDSNMSEPGQKYPHMPKISPGGLPVSSINSVHINIYISTSAHTLARSLHYVSRANNNRFAVVVCFKLAFHASGMRIFFGNFRV